MHNIKMLNTNTNSSNFHVQGPGYWAMTVKVIPYVVNVMSLPKCRISTCGGSVKPVGLLLM